MNLLAGYAVRRAASIFQALQRPTIPLFPPVYRLAADLAPDRSLRHAFSLPASISVDEGRLPVTYLYFTSDSALRVKGGGRSAPMRPKGAENGPVPRKRGKRGRSVPKRPKGAAKAARKRGKQPPRRAALPKMRRAAPDTVGKRPRRSPYALRVASTAFSPLMFHSLT